VKPSRGFLTALFGIAMTIFGWYGPWAWPVAPAFAVIRLLFGSHGGFSDQSNPLRAAFFVLLLVVNVGVWALLLAGLLATGDRVSRARRDRLPSASGG
jgi:hypothetical protein